ncbi:MAG: hypothetical protein OXH14_16950 [Alphaproteobacteria bacterium]|nr:hypothetical protein [Alphaproteobacteria bacterium]
MQALSEAVASRPARSAVEQVFALAGVGAEIEQLAPAGPAFGIERHRLGFEVNMSW